MYKDVLVDLCDAEENPEEDGNVACCPRDGLLEEGTNDVAVYTFDSHKKAVTAAD